MRLTALYQAYLVENDRTNYETQLVRTCSVKGLQRDKNSDLSGEVATLIL